jgi:hypothetical protein
MSPPKAEKSTATISPVVVLQSPMGSAPAGDCNTTDPAVAANADKARTAIHETGVFIGSGSARQFR